MVTRMTSDMNQVQNGVNLTLRLLLRSPFVVFGAMIMAFTVNVRAALVFVVIIPLLCLVVFGIMLFNIPMYRRVQNRLDKVLGSTRENLTGVRGAARLQQRGGGAEAVLRCAGRHVLESRAGSMVRRLVIGGVKPERLEQFRSILDAYKSEDQSMETIQ